jgi:hypothetical protein
MLLPDPHVFGRANAALLDPARHAYCALDRFSMRAVQPIAQ